VRLPPIARQLQRHGALKSRSANDESKRVSASVVKHPRATRRWQRWSAVEAPFGAVIRRPGRAARRWKPFALLEAWPLCFEAGLVNRPKLRCCEHRRPGVGRGPDRDASRGERRAMSLVSPFHRAPNRSSPSAEEPVVASRRRPAVELTLPLPRCARRSASADCSAADCSAGALCFCLHNQHACTNHTVTHSAGQ
jgi:hypothetical protein